MWRKVGIAIASLVTLTVCAVGALWLLGERTLAAKVDGPTVRMITIPTDEMALARGEHIVRSISGCAGCHSTDLAGNPQWATEPGLLPTPNLTPAGVGGEYTTEDWIRAIRHGIAKDGRRLLIMPSQSFGAMSDEDLGSVIAFVTSVDPVEREIPERDGKVMASIFIGAGLFRTADSLAEDIEPMTVSHDTSVDYGRYLVTIGDCSGCHGPNLAGNPGPAGEPGVNITPGGRVDDWTAEEFLAMFRTAIRPDGTSVPIMPILSEYSGMTDEEIEAIRLYLLSLPEREDEGPR